MTRRLWLSLAIPLALAGCRDVTAPPGEQNAVAPPLGMIYQLPSTRAPVHILQEAATAPLLETYQVSFWVRHDRETMVAVNYQPAPGQSVGQPFLRFHIPKFGLMYGPDGARVAGSDSLLITMTIDPVYLSVDFQPSGVVFSSVFHPQLVMWYANANPDLNGDGVVNVWDQWLEWQLAIWGQTTRTQAWFKTPSNNDTSKKYVVGNIYHFTEYGICW